MTLSKSVTPMTAPEAPEVFSTTRYGVENRCHRRDHNSLLSPSNTKILSFAGASGVLGTSVREAFVNAHHQVLGLSHTRSGEGLVQLDLTKETDVEKVLTDFKPNCAFM